MKNLSLAIVFMLSSSLAIGQSSPIYDFIEKHSDRENVTSVFIGPSMAKMFTENAGEDGDELASLFKDFQGMRILVIEDGANDLVSEFKSTVNSNNDETLVEVKDGAEVVRILGKPEKDGYSEIGLIVLEESELVVMSFMGYITADQLGKLNEAFYLELDDLIDDAAD